MSEMDSIKQSYGRCLLKGDLIGRFYEIFLESHPDVKPLFANTDFDIQKQALRQGINLMIMFTNESAVGKSGMKRIRDSHSRSGLNIPPNLYQYWKDSLLQALSEFDSKFSDNLRTEWDQNLQIAIDFIIEGYEN